jgi:hypothetical protein
MLDDLEMIHELSTIAAHAIVTIPEGSVPIGDADCHGDNLFSDVDPSRHRVMTREGDWVHLPGQQWVAFEALYKSRGKVIRLDRVAGSTAL